MPSLKEMLIEETWKDCGLMNQRQLRLREQAVSLKRQLLTPGELLETAGQIQLPVLTPVVYACMQQCKNSKPPCNPN